MFKSRCLTRLMLITYTFLYILVKKYKVPLNKSQGVDVFGN